MTRPLSRNQKNRVAIRRKKIGLLKRRNAGAKNSIRRGPQLAIAAPVSSWICTSTSWSNIVGPRQSIPFDTVEENWEELEEGMRLFSEWTTVYVDDEEIMVEPETHDSLLMAALLSQKEQLPSPSVGRVRTLSCPDLLMDSLAVLCNCLDEITRRPDVAIPLPALEWMMEMDPPNSLVSTVSLPSNWDAVSARLSSSSIFNLFSDLPSSIHQTGTGILSTSSTVSVPMSFWDTSSTVSVAGSAPRPCQRTMSTSSTFTLPISRPSSTVSVPPSFWDAPEPRQLTSSTSSLFVDPSEASSSISTLFMDPSSAHSSGSLSFLTSTSSITGSSFSSSSSICSCCPQALDPEWPVFGYADYQDSSSSQTSSSSACSCFETDVDRPAFVSRAENYHDSDLVTPRGLDDSTSSSSGYETDVDSVPMDMASTVSAVTAVSGTVQQPAACQTSTERLIAECDEMLEKLMEMKKKLREMM